MNKNMKPQGRFGEDRNHKFLPTMFLPLIDVGFLFWESPSLTYMLQDSNP